MSKTDVSDRQQVILARLEATGRVLVAHLACDLRVSAVTIRKDLQDLEQRSLLERVHGGAIATHRSKWNPSIARRFGHSGVAKAAMAEAALPFVRDGDTIILDAGTSTLALARLLRGRAKNLTVITNSVVIVAELVDEAGIELISLGGAVRPHSLAMIGPLTVANLERLHADVVFLGATGASAARGLCTPNLVEAETKAAMVRSAAEHVALVGRSKIGEASLAPYCSWRELDVLITDAPLSASFERVLAAADVELMMAERSPAMVAALAKEDPYAPSALS